LKARSWLTVVVAVLLALPLACGTVGRSLPCGVATSQPGAGLSVHLAATPAVAGSRGEWCTVSRGVYSVVLGVLGHSVTGSRTVLYLSDVQGVDANALSWIDRNLVQQGFQVVVGCYSNAFGPESVPCPAAPDLTSSVMGANMLLDAAAAMPSAQPLAVVGVLQGGVVGLMAVAGRSDVRAIVDDNGSPGTLRVLGLGPGPAFTEPATLHASVLVLGPDSPAYDRTFEGALRAGGTPLEDLVYLPRSTGALTRDAGVGSRATSDTIGFLESELR
jgi:hypothetical protein